MLDLMFDIPRKERSSTRNLRRGLRKVSLHLAWIGPWKRLKLPLVLKRLQSLTSSVSRLKMNQAMMKQTRLDERREKNQDRKADLLLQASLDFWQLFCFTFSRPCSYPLSCPILVGIFTHLSSNLKECDFGNESDVELGERTCALFEWSWVERRMRSFSLCSMTTLVRWRQKVKKRIGKRKKRKGESRKSRSVEEGKEERKIKLQCVGWRSTGPVYRVTASPFRVWSSSSIPLHLFLLFFFCRASHRDLQEKYRLENLTPSTYSEAWLDYLWLSTKATCI